METQLKIEVGKFYRTKSGKKARIYSTDGNVSDMIHGAYLSAEGWKLCFWANNSKAVVDDNISIISKWQEPLDFNPFDLPSWAKWIAMEPNKDWYFFMNKPELHDEEWYSDETYAFIPPQFAPKNYQGNWNESLYSVEELKKTCKAWKVWVRKTQ